MIDRRTMMAAAPALLLAPQMALAQTGGRKRIGILASQREGSNDNDAMMNDIIAALSRLGWRVGENLDIELRSSGEVPRRQAFAKELAAKGLDAIVAAGGPSLLLIAQADPRTPIVFYASIEGVAQPLTGPFNRPTRNITGIAAGAHAIASKRAQLLLELVPGASRVAVLGDAGSIVWVDGSADDPLGLIKQQRLEAPIPLVESRFTSLTELDTALDELGKEPGTVLLVYWQNATHTTYRREIISGAARAKLPAVYATAEIVRDGGLLSLGPDISDERRKAAIYVDRILRGARVADLPVLLPNKLYLAINLKTAAALGLTVPATILARADEVIE